MKQKFLSKIFCWLIPKCTATQGNTHTHTVYVCVYIYIYIYPYVWVKWSKSHLVVSDSLLPHGLYSPWNSPGHNTGVGSLSLLQGIFPTQGSNPCLPHCRQILYQLSHLNINFLLRAHDISSWCPGSIRSRNNVLHALVKMPFLRNFLFPT